MSVLMDYCLYYPDPVGRNLVTKYLEKSPLPADSDEVIALRAMTQAYYSLFQITDVEKGVGVTVQDLLRDETGFVVDIGFGNTAQRHLILASRIIPIEGFLTTSGPVPGPPTARELMVAFALYVYIQKVRVHGEPVERLYPSIQRQREESSTN